MMFETETAPNLLYRSTRERFVDLVCSITPRQLATEVPLCPGWSVKDVTAHVCGVSADFLGDRIADVGSDAWTARQVRERSEATVADVCEEWTSYAVRLNAIFVTEPFLAVRLLGDLIVHLHDIQHALGVEPDRGDEPTRLAAYRQTALVQARTSELLDADLCIEFPDDSRWPAPNAGSPSSSERPQVTLRTSPFDFLRTVTGRRGRAEARALTWVHDGVEAGSNGDDGDGLVDEIIRNALVSYGAVRDDDIGF